MNQQKRWLPLLLIISAVVLAGCGAGGQAVTPTAEEEVTATTVEEAVATTNTPQPEPTQPAEEPTSTPTEPPTPTEEPTSAPTDTPAATPTKATVELNRTEAESLLEVESITSFRMRLSLKVEGDAFAGETDTVGTYTLEGEFTKEPKAQRFVIQGEGQVTQMGDIEMIRLEDTVYIKVGGQWTQAPAGAAPDPGQFYFFSSGEFEAGAEGVGLEFVGGEEVNGRSTIHYRGDKEFLLAADAGGESFNVSDTEVAEFNVWVDESESFLVKMSMVVEGTGINPDQPEASGRLQYVLEYYDFNADITIEAPS